MEKALCSSSKSRKGSKRRLKEEEPRVKKDLNRVKEEIPKTKTKTSSKLKREKDPEQVAGENTKNVQVTPKSSKSRTSKAKRAKDSDDSDLLQASIIVLDETPKSETKNLLRSINNEDGKPGDVGPAYSTPKETPPLCCTPRGSSSGSEDDESPSVFLCTQDEYVVGWDYGSPRPPSRLDYRSKRKGRRRKYKTKLFSPLQPNRRIIPKKAVSDDMSEAIRVFQEATKKIKSHELNVEKSTDETGRENLSQESAGSTLALNSAEVYDEVPLLEEENATDTKSIHETKMPSSKPVCGGDDLIIWLDDDDDDECMVRCSQEIENNLKTANVLEEPPKLSSVNEDIKVEEHKVNMPKLIIYEKPVKQKGRSPFVSDTKSFVKMNTNSNAVNFRHKSPCSVTSKQKSAKMIFSNSVDCQNSKNAEVCKVESNVPKTEPIFDDSFDDILETFKDEDIELLSQGLEDKSEKKGKAPGENFHNSQDKITPNPSHALRFVSKEPSVCKMNEMPKSRNTFQNIGLSNSRIPFNDKNTLPSKAISGVNQASTITKSKNCNNAKPPVQINTNKRENLPSRDTLQQPQLTILDTICNASGVASSNSQKCTPAEIERKRLEAMQRLEKKRKARALFGCSNPIQHPKDPNR